MGLKDYRRKRDFNATPEPAPRRATRSRSRAPTNTFVVQKHAATSLHFDFRLRLGDVLKSWAVPKGPSFDPREKRLAIEVEDHPVEYAEFEGTIPEGQYGAGAVMIWDRGLWNPVNGDPAAALKNGELKFMLEGERLKGKWVLVRTRLEGRQPQWLLIKERDGEARAGVHAQTFATSIATGRTIEEIADNARVVKPKRARSAAPSAKGLPGARAARVPPKLRPQLAVSAEQAPDGDEWLHEVKFDGYRLLITRRGEAVTIASRSGLDWTAKLAGLARAVGERLRVDAVLDGEAVILDSRGVSDFQALQNAIHHQRSASIIFIAFDLPWCDGQDLSATPLEKRKSLLAQLIGARQDGRLRFSEHVVGNGPDVFDKTCTMGLEGIISKKRSAKYTPTRSPSWLKVKCYNQQDFVIGGFTAPSGSREQFGALHIGYFDGRSLRYAGRVGTGFSTETLRKLAARLRPLARREPPFTNPPTGADTRDTTWVKPGTVAQVRFLDWTNDGVVRHPSFRGIREDIDPPSIRREPTRASAAPERPGSKPRSAKRSPTKADQAGKKEPSTAVRLTSPDRVTFPDRGAGYALTKRDIAEYYQAVGPRMLPHVVDRPLSVLRCPDGEGGKSFFQKHPAKGMPAAIATIDVPDDHGGSEAYLCIHDLEGLLGLVQMNVLEFHPWGCHANRIEEPDRLIFDLDPGEGVSWKKITEAAFMVREAMRQARLTAFARLSGGKGVHVVVPIAPGHTWDEAKSFSRAASETLVRLAPQRFVATAGAAKRPGRIFIDYLRNARGATAIASYSTRARPGAPIALPISWDELEGVDSAAAFSPASAVQRIAANSPDPWRRFDQSAASLPNRAKRA